jgi:hypothetical protein
LASIEYLALKRSGRGSLWVFRLLVFVLLAGTGCSGEDTEASVSGAEEHWVPSQRVLAGKSPTRGPARQWTPSDSQARELSEIGLSLEEANRWATFLQPTEQESVWDSVDWRLSIWEAVVEAADTGRPLLLFSMNGHPEGFT